MLLAAAKCIFQRCATTSFAFLLEGGRWPVVYTYFRIAFALLSRCLRVAFALVRVAFALVRVAFALVRVAFALLSRCFRVGFAYDDDDMVVPIVTMVYW